MKLNEKPFYLSEKDIEWVKETLASMSVEEKIGQLFCLTDMITDEEQLKEMIRKYKPGGFMYRSGNALEIQNAQRVMQETSRIPLLLSCNLESGGNGVADSGTFFGRQLQVAATDEKEQAKRLGMICGREGGATGCNWAFAPIVDIDFNWRNPITNVRTYGSDPERVLTMADAYIDGIREADPGMAACIKHFPGDGVDERDQHLLPTVNSLSVEKWESTYGRVYGKLIEKGVKTVMVGHILQPEMTRKLCQGIKDEEILPASVNRYLMTDLLRGQLGFEGLITTDATPMVGFTGMMSRKEALAKALMGGADVLLFCKNIDEDYAGIREYLEKGRITMERIDEAVMRQLALKASLKLHEKQKNNTLVPEKEALLVIGCKEHADWAKECADKAITLVKDNQKLLPISPARTKRIRLTVLGEEKSGAFGDGGTVGELLKNALSKAGFTVSMYDYATMERGEIFTAGIEEMKEKFDLSIVAANIATGSNHTTRRVEWIDLMAANEPWYTKEIPTMFISFCNPYHMIDVPFISTFINCYSSSSYCVDAVVEKIIGKSSFNGKSPVDPWCQEVWGARFM